MVLSETSEAENTPLVRQLVETVSDRDWRCFLTPPWLNLSALGCGKLLDSLHPFPACHGLGITRAGVEDHFPEPERFGRITALLGQHGEIAQGQVAIDALINTENWSGRSRHSPLATFPTFTGH